MREQYDWREFLQNNAKSLSFPALPHSPQRYVRIQRLSQYPKAASRSNNELVPHVLSPVIFTKLEVPRLLTHSFKRCREGVLQHGTCHVIYSVQ